MFTFAVIAVVLMLALWSVAAFGKDIAVGDSIALGAGKALHVATAAKVGAKSCWIADRVPRGHFAHAVVSAGVNDAPGRCLDRILDRLDADNVTLILPAPVNSARAHVADVATRRGLAAVGYVPGRDHLHPKSYQVVAAAVRRTWK